MKQDDLKVSEPTDAEINLHKATNLAAINLLENWSADESGYDERVWAIVKKAIEENRLSMRSRLSE